MYTEVRYDNHHNQSIHEIHTDIYYTFVDEDSVEHTKKLITRVFLPGKPPINEFNDDTMYREDMRVLFTKIPALEILFVIQDVFISTFDKEAYQRLDAMGEENWHKLHKAVIKTLQKEQITAGKL